MSYSIIRVVFEFYPLKGGAVTHIIELSKKINPYLKNQIIVAPDFGKECREFDKYIGIPIVRVKFHSIGKRFMIPVKPLESLLYMIKVYISLKELVKIYKFDIIHFHGISNTAFGTIIGKLLHIPEVGMLHGSTAGYSPLSEIYETILAKLFKPNYALVLDDGSIAPEKFKKIWGERVTVVYHGIDTGIYKPINKNREILEKLGLNKSDFIVLSTSSLIPVKNIDLAIKSFKLFLKKVKKDNAYLLIAGGGSLKAQLIELTKHYSMEYNVKFLGAILMKSIPDYISIADVLIATSLYSNMNRSVQEAMACGKPVVTFNSEGIRRLIRHKKNGFLVKPSDLEEFAEMLRFLYEHPELRNRVGKNARKTIMEERNWETRIKKELKVYEKLLC